MKNCPSADLSLLLPIFRGTKDTMFLTFSWNHHIFPTKTLGFLKKKLPIRRNGKLLKSPIRRNPCRTSPQFSQIVYNIKNKSPFRPIGEPSITPALAGVVVTAKYFVKIPPTFEFPFLANCHKPNIPAEIAIKVDPTGNDSTRLWPVC